MRVAFGSASGVIAAEADDPDTARKKRPAVRRDDLRSTRKFVIWGLAMLLIGLSAGLMLNGIIADQAGGRPVSDVVAVLQLVLFVAAVGVLLYLVADTMGGVSDLAASARATEERLAPPPADSEHPAAHPVAGLAAAEPAAREGASLADADTAADGPAVRESLAPLRESDAELLQRLVMSTDRYDIVCGNLARRYLLSPRQAEVLNLLARGRNASYIEDKLCISLSTAKSHISGVYRKLGVHTQQELLALVQREIDESDRTERR